MGGLSKSMATTQKKRVNKSVLKKIFGNNRILGLAGEKDSGKTNNLYYIISNIPEDVNIYVYGFPTSVLEALQKEHKNIYEISELDHFLYKTDSIFIIDEFQKLHLNDRRQKHLLAEIVDLIYHTNNYIIFSSPNIREFNSVIGSVIERWLLKSIRLSNCINGSQLKKAIQTYSGRFKHLSSISTPKDTILIIDKDIERFIVCDYMKKADNKLNNRKLF